VWTNFFFLVGCWLTPATSLPHICLSVFFFYLLSVFKNLLLLKFESYRYTPKLSNSQFNLGLSCFPLSRQHLTVRIWLFWSPWLCLSPRTQNPPPPQFWGLKVLPLWRHPPFSPFHVPFFLPQQLMLPWFIFLPLSTVPVDPQHLFQVVKLWSFIFHCCVYGIV